MNCESCGADKNEYAIIPKAQPDGKLDTIACVDCARSFGLYCDKHERPHIGFGDDTSACIPCIEDIVKLDGDRIAKVLVEAVVLSEKRDEIYQGISQYLQNLMVGIGRADLGDLGLVETVAKSSIIENSIRPIVTYAARMKLTPEEIIEDLAKNGPDKVFPS